MEEFCRIFENACAKIIDISYFLPNCFLLAIKLLNSQPLLDFMYVSFFMFSPFGITEMSLIVYRKCSGV